MVNRRRYSSEAHLVRARRADVAYFVSAFVVGVCFFAASKLYGLPQYLQSIVLCGLMALYGFSVAAVPLLRVRLDQAADNCYYLGLLFTLMSMAYALWSFSPERTELGTNTTALVSNFGVALATTIAGIFLRVLLQQIRVDPADFERMSRLELAEVSSRIKAELESLSKGFVHHEAEIRQRSHDTIHNAAETSQKLIRALSEDCLAAQTDTLQSADGLRARMQEIESHLADSIRQFTDSMTASASRLASIEGLPAQFEVRVDSLLDGLEGVEVRSSALVETLAEYEIGHREASVRIQSVSTELLASTNALGARQRDFEEKSARTYELISQLITRLESSIRLRDGLEPRP